MKLRIAASLALAVVLGSASAQIVPSRQISRAATSVVGAQIAQPDFPLLYQREVQKNRDLHSQVESLNQRIAEMTHPGGTLVTAYCETPTVSRNTAGASSDCAHNGFGCDPVTGLCRTSVRSSDECAPGHVYCAKTGGCVIPDGIACSGD